MRQIRSMPLHVRKRWNVRFAGLLVALLVSGAALGTGMPVAAATATVASPFDGAKAAEHVRVLSEDIGPRVAGTPGELAGANYLAEELASWGYSVELQRFSVADQRLGTVLLPDGEVWQTRAAVGGLMTEDDSVTGEVVWAGTGQSGTDFPDDIDGKIVLMRYGANSGQRNTQVANAVARGAAGVILYSVSSTIYKSGTFAPSFSPAVAIPVLGGGQAHGEWLLERLADGPVTVTVQTRHYANLESVNVIATRPAALGDAGSAPIVYVSAHLDSVVGSPGANDSGSSVGIAMETARVLAQHHNGDMEIRIGLWGAEESGLLGSRYHVNNLDAAEVARIAGVFHTDMVATSSPRATNLYLFTVDGQRNIVTDAVLDAADRLGVTVPFGRFTGSSDHVSFHNRGVPNIVMSWMRIDSFNPLVWELEPFYHTPEDTYALNIDTERLTVALNVFGSAVLDFVVPPPVVTVSEPDDGLITRDRAVWVQGTVTDADGLASVTVAGQPVTVTESGTFAAPVMLSEGVNEIAVTAVNRAGKVTTVVRTVTADWTAAVLTDLLPAVDTEVEQTETLTIGFTSEPGLTASFLVSMPGTFQLASLPGRALEEVMPGVYRGTYTVPAGALFDNAEVWLFAADAAGNMAQAQAPGRFSAVPYVQPPSLTITEPVAGLRTDKDVIRVSGTAADASGIVSVVVNGRKATVAADGSFGARIVLQEGENNVTVVATAGTGKRAMEVIPVTAVFRGPELFDLEPAENRALSPGETVTLRFKASPGLTAAYQILISGVPGTHFGNGTPQGTPMTEVSPGVYEAVYTAPTNTALTGALVRFNVADEFGHLTMQTAPGRLTVLVAAPVH